MTIVSTSATLPVGPVAQLAEQGTFNPKVVSSILTGPTTSRTRPPSVRLSQMLAQELTRLGLTLKRPERNNQVVE